MFGLSSTELFVVLFIVLLVFGGSKLPQLGKGLGEGLRSFKDAFQNPPPPEPDTKKPPKNV